MKFLYNLLLCGFILLLFITNIDAQDKTDPTRWTPEDIINTENMSSVSISPDNTMVVWTRNKGVQDKDKFVSNIYLTRLDVKDKDGFKTIQLTNGDDDDSSPIFSKDGEYIYFLSSRDKGKKLWKLSIYGGEAQEVNEFKNGISNISWKDNYTLLFRSVDGKTLYEKEAEDLKDNVIVVEDSLHWTPDHVYSYNLKDKSIQRLTDNLKPLNSYSISKDGNWLFYSMQRSRSYASDKLKDPFCYLKNLETGEVKQLFSEFDYPVQGVEFTNDNKGFYFVKEYGSDPKWNGSGISEIFYYKITNSTYNKIDLNWGLGLGSGYDLVNNDIIATLANKATMRLAYYKKNGDNWSKKSIDLKVKNDHIRVLTVSADGSKIIYNHSTSSQLPRFYIADLKENKFSNEQELVLLNKQLQKKAITKSEVITWKGYNEEEVTGLLFYPENYEEGKSYPLILSIHGGPSGVDLDTWSERWSTYPNLLAQRGMFVLKPNYHGSSNHGLKFVESIKGNYYTPGLVDITNAIDLLSDQGKVDKAQLGSMGWSAGAILTTMLTVKYPDMFKVAAPGAGDVNWTSDYGTCRFGVSFDQSYFGGAPWDDVNGKTYNENYISLSPLFEIEKIKTPTIIFHGSEDRAVPRDQGWEYYRGLQQVGNAPVKFLWFPGQPHGLGKITHQLRKMKEEIRWIETFLLNKPYSKNEAFKEDSPLAQLLELQNSKMSNGMFGELNNNILIPETVLTKKDSIAIGKFEVTNAQFKIFRPNLKYDLGKDNHPVIVSFDDAKAYTFWLSDKTGISYRLPNLEEGKVLHNLARKIASKENTFNHWAGYDLVKEDVTELLKKLKELKLELIKSVGETQGSKVGEALVYDLGGNVAEYFEGGIYGYSAYDFFDANNSAMIKSKYAGFRVIRD